MLGDDGMRRQRGKDGIGIVRHRRCNYCVQHGKSLEDATKCPGRGGRSVSTGGKGGIECVTCNSIIKCRCPMPTTTMVGNIQT